ncbi:MAG: phosphate transport system protein [Acidimicrobiaceae bacterium]|jgi:phosphate transport system protein|nr:phosphate transport system protein [Acidimicrobiaceae bacterium]
MPDELRKGFHRDLAEIDGQVIRLLALVGEGLAAATEALLSTDIDIAKDVIARDHLIDEVYLQVEHLVQQSLARQSPMAADLRFLLSVLRIVPELERSHDLAEHIARRATRGLAAELTPRIRGLIEQMGRIGVEMWRAVADAYIERDADAADKLNAQDDELDELHVSLTAELVSGVLSVPVVVEMALVARFYERLGDHAVNIASRVKFLARGDA